MPVLIHSARRGKNSAVIFLSALLVEGSAVSAGRKPPLVDFTGPKHLRMVYLAVAVICWLPPRPPSRTPAEGVRSPDPDPPQQVKTTRETRGLNKP